MRRRRRPTFRRTHHRRRQRRDQRCGEADQERCPQGRDRRAATGPHLPPTAVVRRRRRVIAEQRRTQPAFGDTGWLHLDKGLGGGRRTAASHRAVRGERPVPVRRPDHRHRAGARHRRATWHRCRVVHTGGREQLPQPRGEDVGSHRSDTGAGTRGLHGAPPAGELHRHHRQTAVPCGRVLAADRAARRPRHHVGRRSAGVARGSRAR